MTVSAEVRGRLEVFLGCAPGVGKTYEMLAQAHALKADGVDVVVGVVETHGRSATAAMIDGLEVIDRIEFDYRGTVMDEMDLDTLLQRRPQVVLVDELAHTNATGSRNPKRWRDVDELRDAGIDVMSTINIQHLESLNDVVKEITGIVQRETVPDDVVRSADEIELVDIAPQALRQRLSAGKVYPGDRVGGALSNYFRQGNLTALRELALLWLADQVDDNLADYRAAHEITDTWEARERVVVAITGGPESATLLRRASRIASRSSAELVVVHIVRDDGLTDPATVNLAKLTELAKGFGAQMHSIVGDDVPATLLEFARGVNATQLVLGTSRRSRWQRILDEGVGSAVVRQSGKIDVHMVTHEETKARNVLDIRNTRLHRPLSWVFAVIVPMAAAGILVVLDRWLGFASQTALFFMVVLAVSMLGGIGPAALSAIVSGLLLNFLFTTPRYTFTINETDNAVTIIVMLMIAIAVAVLVDSATVRRVQAQRAGRDAELLALFAGAVLSGEDLEGLLRIVQTTYDQAAVSVVRIANREPNVIEGSVGEDPPVDAEHADTVCEVPGGAFAMLLRGPKLGGRDRRVLVAVANQAAGVVQRKKLASQAAEARALAETDQLRRALLSAVSHDLRTPLAAVKASVSSLRGTEVVFSPQDTAELLATIEESTDHLTALVGNLLDSSRLAAGVVRPELQMVYLNEVVSNATVGIARFDPVAAERVEVDIDPVLLYADAGLLERVLANLIDNALRHSGDATPVQVRGRLTADDPPRCSISVVDHGPGVPVDARPKMFSAFQRLGDHDTVDGVGLGLSVAQGFVQAMNGVISPSSSPGGGLTMTFELPLGPPAGESDV
ncbi:sensor histidine kinase KdpD [Williamsia sp.]|uniref:sensor histidine kinase KdpD n=1 Tax=Williamsia sp. TaxID=1872085 RepID=UPI002F943D51